MRYCEEFNTVWTTVWDFDTEYVDAPCQQGTGELVGRGPMDDLPSMVQEGHGMLISLDSVLGCGVCRAEAERKKNQK